jgi:hypothetical protein
MRTWRIPQRQAGEGAVLAMAMTTKMARVKRTRREVRHGLAKGREQRTGRGKGSGRGREMVTGMVLLNRPQGEMISLVPLVCRCRRKGMRQTWARRANLNGYIYSRKHRSAFQFPQTMIMNLPRSRTVNMTQNLTLMWIFPWRMM